MLGTRPGFTNVTPVPEPSTWAMMLIGFAGLGYAGHRASRKSAA
jgi:PEP-CTERM motif